VRKEGQKLERFYGRIASARVVADHACAGLETKRAGESQFARSGR
jgi:hypothetical protein